MENLLGEYNGIRELRAKAVQYYSKQLQGTAIENAALKEMDANGNGTVCFTGAGKREMKGTSAKENKLLMVPQLPALIQNATKITTNVATKERHANETFYYLHATALIGEEPTPIIITLVKRNDKSIQYYNHILPSEEQRKNTPVSPGPESSI
ncbi:MAG: hypothetical protein IJ812_00250 [Schwartzia sp.]|nr:hypothetical protein [Schwartzia sp. (in: firmicutes)]